MIIACISASQVPSNKANSIQMMKTCQALSQLGHEVHLYVPEIGQRANEIDLGEFYGLRARFGIERLASQHSLHRYDFAYKAVRRASKFKAEIAYVWFLQAAIASQLAGLPVAMEMHGPPEGSFGPVLFRRFLKLPGEKRILPITHALAAQLEENYQFDGRKQGLIQVSPNGVDLERFEQLPEPHEARLLLGLQNVLTIGYTGHLYPGRGMELLLGLARRFPQVSFLWVGGSTEDVNTWGEKLAEERLPNVNLMGFVNNDKLPLYQAAADVLLMPYEKAISGSSGGDSAGYASPMKMFEYMASQRAIISSDLPVIREVLNPSNAVLCPPGDIEAWSKEIAGLLSDEGKRKSLADKAWQDVQRYTWLERARKALCGFPNLENDITTN